MKILLVIHQRRFFSRSTLRREIITLRDGLQESLIVFAALRPVRWPDSPERVLSEKSKNKVTTDFWGCGCSGNQICIGDEVPID
jgi:hypothetical protein